MDSNTRTPTWAFAVAGVLLLVAKIAAAGPQAPPPTVQGRVIDAHSMAPIKGARVAVGARETTTDAAGRFALAVAPGSWTLAVSAAGYLPDTQPVTIGATLVELEVLLINQSQFRELVTVMGVPGTADETAPALPLSPLEVRSIAGAAENVFRVLQTLPGVTATEDFGSRLSVRGGGPDQNLTIMDGVEIYNPYRLFGLTSAFNPETVDNFELTAGGFGAKYGDRLSSLLLVENRAGRGDRAIGGSLALGLTDSNVILEGALPGGAAGSWLVTGRRTYYDLVAERFVDQDLPSFADLQMKTVWGSSSGRRLTLFGLRSRENADAVFTNDGRPGERVGFESSVRNDLAALSVFTPIGSRLAARTTASWYVNTDVLGVDADVRNEARVSNAPGADSPLVDVVFTRALRVRDLALRQELTARVSPRHFVETGFDVHGLRTGWDWTIEGERNLGQANGSSIRGGAGLPPLLHSVQRVTRVGAWIQDRWSGPVTLEPGVRIDRSSINGETTVSPRVAVLWPIAGVRVRAAGGLFTQSPGYEKLLQADYFVDLTDAGGVDLRSERAVHAIAGVERDMAPGTTTRVEAFFKRYDRVIVGRLETPAEAAARTAPYDFPAALAFSVPSAPQITADPINGAAGRAYGFDVYLMRRATRAATRLTGWASYTFSRADRTAYGRRFPFDYDRPHALSIVGTYRVGRSMEIAATFRAASGFPTTLPVGVRVSGVVDGADADRDGNVAEIVPQRDDAGRLVWEIDTGGVEHLNSSRLPAFARLDGRITWRKTRWQIYLEVWNLLNRANAGALSASLEPDPQSDRPRITYTREGGIPRLPSVGLRVRF